MSAPFQAAPVVRMARSLTDEELAQRLDGMRINRRRFDKATTNALLEEAARRLRWGRDNDK